METNRARGGALPRLRQEGHRKLERIIRHWNVGLCPVPPSRGFLLEVRMPDNPGPRVSPRTGGGTASGAS